MKDHTSSGAIYGMGVIGAAFYFLQHTNTLLGMIIGLVKAIFWPAIVIFKLFENLNL